MPKQKINKTSLVITIILTLGLSISFQPLLAAWVSPTVDPPNGAIAQFLNEGAANQAKLGGLSLGGNLAVDGSMRIRETDTPPATIAGYTQLYAKNSLEVGPDSFTKLLIHSDTTNGNTSFTDSSVSAHSITRQGDVIHSTAVAPEPNFGATSMYFDGAGDYLEIADSDDWNFGSEDFTIDFWVYLNSNVSDSTIFEQYDNSDDEWFLRLRDAGDLTLYSESSGVQDVNLDFWETDLQLSTWHHVAVVKNGNNYGIFVDGILSDGWQTDIDGFSQQSAPLRICYSNHYNSYFDGYLDEIRISKGVARWINNFTPPSTPYGQDTESGLVFKNSNGTEIIIGSGGVTAIDTLFDDSGSIVTLKDNKDLRVEGDIDTVNLTATGQVCDTNGCIETSSCPSGFTAIESAGNLLGCMQNNEEGTGTWYAAQDNCYSTYGGRLPSWGEWYIAMNNYVLTDEVDDPEWIDEATYSYTGSMTYASIAGNGSLTTINVFGPSATGPVYRCWIPR